MQKDVVTQNSSGTAVEPVARASQLDTLNNLVAAVIAKMPPYDIQTNNVLIDGYPDDIVSGTSAIIPAPSFHTVASASLEILNGTGSITVTLNNLNGTVLATSTLTESGAITPFVSVVLPDYYRLVITACTGIKTARIVVSRS